MKVIRVLKYLVELWVFYLTLRILSENFRNWHSAIKTELMLVFGMDDEELSLEPPPEPQNTPIIPR